MIRIMMMIAFTDANVYSCIDLYVIKSIVLNGCDLVIFSRARSHSHTRRTSIRRQRSTRGKCAWVPSSLGSRRRPRTRRSRPSTCSRWCRRSTMATGPARAVPARTRRGWRDGCSAASGYIYIYIYTHAHAHAHTRKRPADVCGFRALETLNPKHQTLNHRP